MALKKLANGKLVKTAGGKLTEDVDCCCNYDCCAAWSPDRTLYLSIDSNTLDGGETCTDTCDFTKAATASLDPGELTDGYAEFIWLDSPAPGVQFLVELSCDAGVLTLRFGANAIRIVDGGNADLCLAYVDADVVLDPLDFTCEPFLWTGTAAVTYWEPFPGGSCGTGTMTFTITE